MADGQKMDKNSKVKLHTGSVMPIIGLGTWQLKDNTADTIAYALEIGYKSIDTSSDYGTQPGIGKGIKKSGVARDNFFLTTKGEEYDDAYERTKSNLVELGLPYIDLILIHRPPEDGAGEELWEGLIRAKKEDLVRDIGVSNYSIDIIEKLIEKTGEIPVVNQIEWSPFGYSDEIKTYSDAKGIVIQAYSPLTRRKRTDNATLEKLSEKYGKSLEQILLRWGLQKGSVPLPKANQKKHLEENLDVFDFEITEEDIKLLDSLNEMYSSFGNPLPYD